MPDWDEPGVVRLADLTRAEEAWLMVSIRDGDGFVRRTTTGPHPVSETADLELDELEPGTYTIAVRVVVESADHTWTHHPLPHLILRDGELSRTRELTHTTREDGEGSYANADY